MASPFKTITATCTNVKLLADGRQEVSLHKPATPPTTPPAPGTPMTVSPDEFACTVIIANPNEGVYQVGKTYTVTING